MKILVTGGGGFIGMALVRRLVGQGNEVSSFSRNYYPEHSILGVSSFQGNLLNPADIDLACKGVDVVFHVAAKVGLWGKYADFFDVNVTGTENVINACRNARVGKLIFTSSASVVFDGSDLEGVDETVGYPEKPLSAYTATKARAERLVLQANSDSLKTISLRPHVVWGPGDIHLIPGILNRARSGKLRRPGWKDYYIDTTYIDNFIDAQLLALNALSDNQYCSGKAFFITNGQPIKVWDFINSIINSAGLPPVQKSIPKNLALSIAWILEKTHSLFRLKSEPYITRFAIHEMSAHHWFNISAAKNSLGYTPKTIL